MEKARAQDGPGRADRRVALWLGVLAFAVYALVNCGYLDNTDSELQYLCAARFADHGTPTLETVPPALARLVEPGRGGYQMQFGIGSAALHLPAVAAGRAAHALAGVSADGAGTFLDSFAGPACAALTVAALWLLARTLGLSRRGALLAAGFHGVATYAFVYARSAYYETPIAMCLVLAALLSRDPRRRTTTALAAGALAGFAVTIKLVWLLAVPFHLLLLFDLGSRSANLRRVAAFLVPVAAALGAVLAWNAWRFGDPLIPGYSDTFRRPLSDGLERLLVNAHSSYLLFSPVLVLAVPGLVAMFRRDRLLAAYTAGLTLLTLLVLARSWWPEGGAVHGPRYLVPLTPFLSLAAACFVAERTGWALRACIALACVSAAVQLPGLVVAHQDVYRARTAVPESRRGRLPPYLVMETILAWEKLRGRDDPYDLTVFEAAPTGTTLRTQVPGVNWWWIRGARRGWPAWLLGGAAVLGATAVAALAGLRRAWRSAPGG